MRSDKAWYWLAAGVLALGLNGAYQDGQLGWAHVLADRASAAVERVTLRGQSFLAMAEVMLGRDSTAFARTEGTIERVQNKIVCARVAQAQRQIAMAHVREQLAQARVQQKLAMAQMKMDRMRTISIDRANQFSNCAGFSKVVVNTPDLPKIDLSNIPDIQVPDLSDFDPMSDSHANGPI
jgi:ribosomal protein L27